MEFKIIRKENENLYKYPTENLQLANQFAQQLKVELGDFLMGVVVFGSTVRKNTSSNSDIDVLVLSDDTSFEVTEELTEGYRLIVENVIARVTTKLHVTSMTFTSFWEYAKAGDPVIVNILRDGYPLIDKGFFYPLQRLLKRGRIRPSEESVWRYFGRSPMTLLNSRWHVLQGTLDLYWAVIDAAHAALMRKDQIPPTPEHVADMLGAIYVKKKLLEPKYVETMKNFYNLSRKITHREIKEIRGPEYEKYFKDADDFVKRMKLLIEKGKF